MEYVSLILLIILVFLAVFFYQRLLISKKNIFIKLLPIFILSIIILFLYFFPKSENEEAVISPIKEFVEKTVQTATKTSGLEDVVKQELENEDGVYAVAIKNLKTNESYYYNENRKFTSASLYKLWYMAEVFRQVESGKLSMDQTLSRSAEEINRIFDIDDEYAEITEGYVTYTVEKAIDKMITISDNYAAHLLGVTVGVSNVKETMSNYGLNDSRIDVSPPHTTAKDIIKYYQLLYDGKLISKSASNQMLEILKRQTWNDRLPKYLPDNVIVAHKTGELGAVKHDAGIVYGQTGDYIIVLLSETNNQTTAAEIEAKISEKVWKYFNQ